MYSSEARVAHSEEVSLSRAHDTRFIVRIPPPNQPPSLQGGRGADLFVG